MIKFGIMLLLLIAMTYFSLTQAMPAESLLEGTSGHTQDSKRMESDERNAIDERQLKFMPPGKKSAGNYATGLENEQPESDKRDFSFGTALGHSKTKGNSNNDYLSDWWKTYNALYPGGNKQKRQGIRFGTGLGHGSRHQQASSHAKQLYIKHHQAKFNELFGGKRGIEEDEEGAGYSAEDY